jgi:hypothetical protein
MKKERGMKQIFLLAILVFLSVAATAQTTTTANVNPTCQLPLNQSPSIRGIKLGLKLDEVLRDFPGAEQNEWVKQALQQKTVYPNLGVIYFSVLPSSYSTRDQFRGISTFSFSFIDDRLAAYSVVYARPPDGPLWPRVDDWVNKIAASFNLPEMGSWSMEQGDRTLKCRDFQMRASNLNAVGNLTVATLDLPYKEQETRRAAFDEKLRRDFKP